MISFYEHNSARILVYLVGASVDSIGVRLKLGAQHLTRGRRWNRRVVLDVVAAVVVNARNLAGVIHRPAWVTESTNITTKVR